MDIFNDLMDFVGLELDEVQNDEKAYKKAQKKKKKKGKDFMASLDTPPYPYFRVEG